MIIETVFKLMIALMLATIGFIIYTQWEMAAARDEFRGRCHAAGGIYVPIKHNGVYCFPKGNVINIQ